MKSWLAFLLIWAFLPIVLLSQKTMSVQVGGGSTAISWISFTVEAKAHTFEQGSVVQALAVSTGYGLPFLNAAYLPIDFHGIFFHGSDHIDVTLGTNIQTAYKQLPDDGWRDVQSSVLNPTSSVSYRYEPETGGFCFHIGLGAMYAIKDSWLIPNVVIGAGFAF